uniref:Uncharacterized protein n=1 Tax=Solanum lycopersicum TaxID=4081 RepID=A0A494G9A6_SOLLC
MAALNRKAVLGIQRQHGPARDFLVHVFLKCGLVVTDRVGAKPFQAVPDGGIGHALHDGLRELLDGCRRRAGRYEQAEPRTRGHARKRRLGKRGHVGQRGVALVAGHRQRLELAGLHLREHFGQVGEHDLHLAAHHVVERLRAALVGHVRHLRAGQRAELLAGQMRRGAGAARSVVDAAGVGLRIGGEFACRIDGHRWIDHQQQRHRRQVGQADEIARK